MEDAGVISTLSDSRYVASHSGWAAAQPPAPERAQTPVVTACSFDAGAPASSLPPARLVMSPRGSARSFSLSAFKTARSELTSNLWKLKAATRGISARQTGKLEIVSDVRLQYFLFWRHENAAGISEDSEHGSSHGDVILLVV